jgi:hypothetical protein
MRGSSCTVGVRKTTVYDYGIRLRNRSVCSALVNSATYKYVCSPFSVCWNNNTNKWVVVSALFIIQVSSEVFLFYSEWTLASDSEPVKKDAKDRLVIIAQIYIVQRILSLK